MFRQANVRLFNIFIFFNIAAAYVPRFLNGRHKNGFVGGPKHSHDFHLPEDNWMLQKLNHFDPTEKRTWQQRYFVNEKFYQTGGPIFLMIGGEGTANPIWMVEGQWIKYAQQYNALCLMLEHRYYGKSHPTSNLTVESLTFLSSEQALADLAYFRQFVVHKHNLTKNKWIAFGGSYPGSLAAWLRLKYPHLIDGSVSTSAPLQAVMDFKEYLGVVRDALATTNHDCNQQIRNATLKLESVIQTETGRKQLKQQFRLCDNIDINNPKDVSNLYSTLAGNFEGVVQYNRDNRQFEGAVGTNVTIDVLCSLMCDSNYTPLYNYARVNDLILTTYKQTCLDFKYDKMIEDMKQTEWKSEAAEGGRQWMYQSCTEFGYFQTSDLTDQPFGHHFDLEFSVGQCSDIFGADFNITFLANAIKWTNNYYGGLGIKVTKIVFVNGSIDPWHALGVTSDLGPNTTAIYIKGTAHCANMYPDSPSDPPNLRQARSQIQQLIGQWLQ